MTSRVLLLAALLLLEYTCGAPADDATGPASSQALNEENNDLKTAASSGYAADRYSDWGRYPSGQGITGYGSIDSRYNYGAYGGYDIPYGYNAYDGEYPRQGGYSGYGSYPGNSGYGGYRPSYGGGYGGNGGYGGYSGNGGISSYYGYSNPAYQGANHLGYGYYNRRPGYGNIYNSGITPSLVTGYRGYSKK